MPTSNARAVWKPWLAAILWTLIIATESSDMFSSSHTSRYLYPFLTWLFGPIDPARYEFWHGIGRKAGHIIGYGILCLLYFRAWRVTLPDFRIRWSGKWAALALLMTAFVAALDEWHQSYIPSRTGTVHDVLLDSSAGLLFLVLTYLWVRRRKEPEPVSAD